MRHDSFVIGLNNLEKPIDWLHKKGVRIKIMSISILFILPNFCKGQFITLHWNVSKHYGHSLTLLYCQLHIIPIIGFTVE